LNPELALSHFDYFLPPELIAQTPAADRTAGRLLHLDAAGALHDRQFTDFPALLRPDDLLVFNDTRVIKARLTGHKASGGKVEVLVERIVADAGDHEGRAGHRAWAHVRASKAPRPGTTLLLAEEQVQATVIGREDALFLLAFNAPVAQTLARHGATPLPPYITHAAGPEDDKRYQTVYARAEGAVAAPTAGLHFDQAMLDRLDDQGIGRAFLTLHVGAGTFQPVRTERLEEHIMHAERYHLSAETLARIAATRARGGRIIAIGTTSARALESAAARLEVDKDAAGCGGLHGDTRLFIVPGYRFRWVDALLTNFHLPQSTLLMMVSALAGMDPIRRAYAHAVQSRYRFFSYGDAMFIESPKA